MHLPPSYLDLSLRSILILRRRFPSGYVPIEVITDAIAELAAEIEKHEASCTAEQNEWLAQQFENLTTEVDR